MNDFKIIARLLAAIKASEESPVFDVALVDEKVIKATAKQRDNLAIKLQKAGYIEGLTVIDDIDNQTVPYIAWNQSKPAITLSGLEWMDNNDSLKKAVKEIKEMGTSVAAKIIGNIIQGM